jgi:hypothetical protein
VKQNFACWVVVGVVSGFGDVDVIVVYGQRLLISVWWGRFKCLGLGFWRLSLGWWFGAVDSQDGEGLRGRVLREAPGRFLGRLGPPIVEPCC